MCKKDYYLTEHGCELCPDGAVCRGGKSLPVNIDGYWGDSRNTASFRAAFYACAEGACLSSFECAEGFEGRHCSIPSEDWLFFGSFPIKCPSGTGWSRSIFVIGLYAVLTTFVFGIIWLVAEFEFMSMWLNSIQTVALIYSFSFAWPETSG